MARSWVASNNLLVGSFLETHVSEANASAVLTSTLPGWRSDNNYCFSELGRIWVVWHPSVSVITFKKSDQLLLCSIRLPSATRSFAIAFVYGRNTPIERRTLWNDISSLSPSSPLNSTPWALLGDFNQIANASEHFSILQTTLSLGGMEEFQSCLRDNDLDDVPSRGVFYTWSNHQESNPILRKLDRALANDHWFSTFPDSYAVFDPPGDSDHAPCILNLEHHSERTKKCFRYFSFLSTHPTFLSSLLSAWEDQILVGSAMFSLGEHLRAAKKCCKKLNRLGFSNIQQRTKEALLTLETIQNDLLSNPSDSLFREEHVARKKWVFFAAALEIFYKQKSRIRWLLEGDANTSFFHRAVIAHQARNFISYLRRDDNERVDNVSQIKDMIITYYSHLLGSESDIDQPLSVERIQELQPFRCNTALAAKLTAIPSDEEIIHAVFSMPKNKAPGPDGFSAEFFWEAWVVVKDSTVAAVREFFTTGHLLKRFNATAITLIPKEPGADRLTKFRPVSCCNTVYKVITRLLSMRLKLFISDAVQGNQVGFIKGRLLCENVLLASELVENFHCAGTTTRGCLQIDISKAYDNVNWTFLINVLKALQLPDIFINWIWVCISSPSYSIAFNGELIGFFQGKKGIRQGDPMSSHLFVLVMDVLSRSLDLGAANNMFRPHPNCLAPLVTHLSFADDVLVFFDGSTDSIAGILNILDDFKAGSGLGINRQKMALMIDGGNFVQNRDMAAHFDLTQGALPVRYLGVPLMAQKMRRQDYQPLIDKINQRFTSWTAKHLSYAGRLQLLKSVINSTINFWSSIFILPNQCLLKLEQMCCAFLWKGAPNSARGAKIAWDVICTSKECGGLGLRRLTAWNKVLALKLIWLLFSAAGSLWVSWVRLNLIGTRCFWDLNPSSSGSWIWRSLCKLRPLARPFIHCDIGSGITARFWQDNWTGLGPIIDLTGPHCPQTIGLPLHAVVRDAIAGNAWRISSSRSRNPTITLLKTILPNPEAMIESMHDDTYLWKPDHHAPSNTFSAARTWLSLYPPTASVPWHRSIWFTGSIPKHSFISWIVTWNRLHTRDRLRNWGLAIPSTCLLCNTQDESRDHLFFRCSFSSSIWRHFTTKANLNPPDQYNCCLLWLNTVSRNKNLTLILKLIFQGSVYFLWRERNIRLHSISSRDESSLIRELKLIIRARLDPLSRVQRCAPPALSLLATWFSVFQ